MSMHTTLPPEHPGTAPAHNGEFPPDGAATTRAMNRYSKGLLYSTAAAMVLAAFTLFLPAPYVLESPGPTYNTIGKAPDEQGNDSSEDLISVAKGAQSYPNTGALLMTTVFVSGNPGDAVSSFDALTTFLNPDSDVVPFDFLYPPEATKDQVQQGNRQSLTSSQNMAIAAGLRQSGYTIAENLKVVELSENSPAQGKIQALDTITAVDGKEVSSLSQLRSLLAQGEGAEVRVKLQRSGTDVEERVTPQNRNGQWILGVVLEQTFEFPVDIQYAVEGVGGSSAGMMFALGIMDKLNAEDMTGGKSIAGTGTIESDGVVGPIGGIRQKMIGAKSSGADYFLAPEANCDEVVGNIPDALSVVKVATLDDAETAVRAIGSGTDPASLPQCTR